MDYSTLNKLYEAIKIARNNAEIDSRDNSEYNSYDRGKKDAFDEVLNLLGKNM